MEKEIKAIKETQVGELVCPECKKTLEMRIRQVEGKRKHTHKLVEK